VARPKKDPTPNPAKSVKATVKPDRVMKPDRKVPEKCMKCSALTAVQAKLKHGPEGDGCWDSSRCPSRRSYAKNRDRINLTRARKRGAQLPHLQVDGANLIATYAVLHVWREARESSPVHALGIEIWRGNEQISIIPTIECVGVVPSQVHRYLEKVLELLEKQYSIRKFAAMSRHDPSDCPVKPCSLRHQRF
jgi:hypothetical protein